MSTYDAWQSGWEAGYARALADAAARIANSKSPAAPRPPTRFRQRPERDIPLPPTPVDPPDGVDRLNTVEGAQVKLGGLGRSSVYRLMDAGELRSVKIGKRRLIPDSAIADYVEGLR